MHATFLHKIAVKIWIHIAVPQNPIECFPYESSIASSELVYSDKYRHSLYRQFSHVTDGNGICFF